MAFQIIYTKRAKKDLDELKGDKSKKRILKAVIKSVKFLTQSPKHPSLKTHQYHSIAPVYPGQKVWEVYAQDKTPAAYRVFWCYGPKKNQITIISITPHP